MSSSKRRFSYGLTLAIVVYVALRALILLTNFEEVVMAMFELYPMGTMAELKLQGVHYPLRFYYDNAAGQLVMGQAAIPLYALFGSNYLVLKCLPALLGLATLVFLWLMLDRHFSRTAANIGALLFALAPGTVVRYSVVCSGNHFENLFFTTLFLWFFYRHHGVLRTRLSLFFTAFAAGFALLVFLGVLIPIGICAGMHVGLRGWKRTLQDLPVALAGFVLGTAPLVLVNALTSARGFGFLSAKFGEQGARAADVSTWDRMSDFLGAGLLESGMFEPALGLTGADWGVVFVSLFALAYLLSLPSVVTGIGGLLRGTFGSGTSAIDPDDAFNRIKLVPFVLYVPLAALAFGIANFRLRGYVHPMVAGGYRYYLPTLLFALILIAIWAARAWEKRGAARVGTLVLGGGALACGATSLGLVDWTLCNVGSGVHYPGYNFAQLARGLVGGRNAVPTEEIVMRVSAWPDVVREPVVRALGFNLGFLAVERSRREKGADWTLDLEEFMRGYPAEWHPLMASGAGTSLRFRTRMNANTGELPNHLRRLRPSDGPLAEAAVAGAAAPTTALTMGREVFDTFSENISLLTMDTPHVEAFARGFGLFCGRLKARGIPQEVEFAEEFRGRFDSAAFRDGWQRGVDGAER
ncbi:MAG: hypothetical protein JNL28_15390 [Planctomycetes bacterium]|nr:hypothetical protein [Planctomycetota bacterium]